MRKHAYLIVAHKDQYLLETLLARLDDERNDIYLHIDRKSPMSPNALKLPRHAQTYLMPRMDVTWGGDSQIECTLRLLRQSTQDRHHAYYHLLSGSDLPLQSQDTIHSQLAQANGANYVNLDHAFLYPDDYRYRLNEYHFLQNRIGRRTDNIGKALSYAEKSLIKMQKAIGVNRIKGHPYHLYKGSNWFSITDELARYIVDQTATIHRDFFKSFLCDEVFLQTIAYNSPFASTIIDDDLRLVDWTRGNPYIWRYADLHTLQESSKLFARKFDSQVDRAIIDALHC